MLCARRPSTLAGIARLALLGSLLLGSSAFAQEVDLEADCDDRDDFREDPNPLDGTPMAWVRTSWNPNGIISDCADHGDGDNGLHIQGVGTYASGFLSEKSYEGDVTFRAEVKPLGDESDVLLLAQWDPVLGRGYSVKLNRRRNGRRELVIKRWMNWISTRHGEDSVAVDPDDTVILELSVEGMFVTFKAWVPTREEQAASISYRDPAPLPASGIVGFEVGGGETNTACFRWVCVETEGKTPPTDPQFIRGDGNDDGDVDIADPVYTLNWLFAGGPAPGCLASADTNGDSLVDISDPVSLLNHLFGGGPPPVAPYPECGLGTPEDYDDNVLGCASPEHCGG